MEKTTDLMLLKMMQSFLEDDKKEKQKGKIDDLQRKFDDLSKNVNSLSQKLDLFLEKFSQ